MKVWTLVSQAHAVRPRRLIAHGMRHGLSHAVRHKAITLVAATVCATSPAALWSMYPSPAHPSAPPPPTVTPPASAPLPVSSLPPDDAAWAPPTPAFGYGATAPALAFPAPPIGLPLSETPPGSPADSSTDPANFLPPLTITSSAEPMTVQSNPDGQPGATHPADVVRVPEPPVAILLGPLCSVVMLLRLRERPRPSS
jgi:hypothetical protein